MLYFYRQAVRLFYHKLHFIKPNTSYLYMSILLIAERHGGDDVQRQSRDMRCKYGAAAADVVGKKGGAARQGAAGRC